MTPQNAAYTQTPDRTYNQREFNRDLTARYLYTLAWRIVRSERSYLYKGNAGLISAAYPELSMNHYPFKSDAGVKTQRNMLSIASTHYFQKKHSDTWHGEKAKRDDLTQLLIRLGKRVERAELARDFKSIIAIDKQISDLIVANPDVYVGMWVIRGQNNIRKARGLAELDL